jgi:hypothetical protein
LAVRILHVKFQLRVFCPSARSIKAM